MCFAEFGRQLNGLGGGTSTTSKIAVVGISEEANVDLDYTFVAVPIKSQCLDFTVNWKDHFSLYPSSKFGSVANFIVFQRETVVIWQLVSAHLASKKACSRL